ncbi:MAG: SoxR reducing system RseC family protein [Spirochaetota bacterium]|nr:SoxR reducing system RseC family protein [Spirochaetota bacterium]
MREEGVIREVIGNKALVILQRSTMCNACSNKGMCRSLGGGNDMEVEVLNTAGATKGDRVQISLESSSFLKMTFLVYIVPLLSLVLGAFVGLNVIGSHSPDHAELFSLLLAIIFFALAFIVISILSKSMGKRKKYMPEITKVINIAP